MKDTGTERTVGADALRRAIAVDGVTSLASSIGVSYQLVQGWLAEGRKFAAPAEYCPAIERATNHKVRCEELRPDVEWSVLRGKQPAREAA